MTPHWLSFYFTFIVPPLWPPPKYCWWLNPILCSWLSLLYSWSPGALFLMWTFKYPPVPSCWQLSNLFFQSRLLSSRQTWISSCHGHLHMVVSQIPQLYHVLIEGLFIFHCIIEITSQLALSLQTSSPPQQTLLQSNLIMSLQPPHINLSRIWNCLTWSASLSVICLLPRSLVSPFATTCLSFSVHFIFCCSPSLFSTHATSSV